MIAGSRTSGSANIAPALSILAKKHIYIYILTEYASILMNFEHFTKKVGNNWQKSLKNFEH